VFFLAQYKSKQSKKYSSFFGDGHEIWKTGSNAGNCRSFGARFAARGKRDSREGKQKSSPECALLLLAFIFYIIFIDGLSTFCENNFILSFVHRT